MKKIVVYVHGKDGTIQEANHYQNLFGGYEIVGFDYKANTPMAAIDEFASFFAQISKEYDSIILIANSIGAYFSLLSIDWSIIDKAYLISPIVDMEYLIKKNMDGWNITEEELRKRKVIKTSPDDEMTWEYLSFVRNHPIKWKSKTNILYGSIDFIMPKDIILEFANRVNASLTIMDGGEHWFHTKEQMKFLDKWIQEN